MGAVSLNTFPAQRAMLSYSSTALGSLMDCGGLSGTVQIAGQDIEINLAEDSLSDIQSRINEAVPEGVSASIISSSGRRGQCFAAAAHRGHDGLQTTETSLSPLGYRCSNNAFGERGPSRLLTWRCRKEEPSSMRLTPGRKQTFSERCRYRG